MTSYAVIDSVVGYCTATNWKVEFSTSFVPPFVTELHFTNLTCFSAANASKKLAASGLAEVKRSSRKFNVKKMKPQIGNGILRRKCEMNMGSKIYRLASRPLRTVCFGIHLLVKVLLVRLIQSRVLGAPHHCE